MLMKWKFKELLGECQQKTGERITYADIHQDTGLSANTLSTIATDKAQRVDLVTLDKLLGFFSKRLQREVSTNDLLIYVNCQEEKK